MRTDDTPFDNYLTRKQLRDAIPGNVSLRTIDRWVTLRIGPPRVTIGRTILYPKSGIQNWLNNLEVSGLTEAA